MGGRRRRRWAVGEPWTGLGWQSSEEGGCYHIEGRGDLARCAVISLSNMKRTSSDLLVPSRRDFLRVAGLAGVAAAAGLPSWRTTGLRAAPPVFEEIPPSVSGITWVHENAMSPERYLPETMGPGVAFFDYDNDGWMDLFMVNSGGPVDFYTPKAPLRNALYKNNRDGTFTDVTEKAGLAGGTQFGMGCAVGDFDNDGYPDRWSRRTASARCTRTTATARSRTSPRTPTWPARRTGRRARCGSTTTTTASSTCSSAALWSSR